MTKETKDYLQHICNELDAMQQNIRIQAANTIENDVAVQFSRGALAALSAVKTEVLKCIKEVSEQEQPADAQPTVN